MFHVACKLQQSCVSVHEAQFYYVITKGRGVCTYDSKLAKSESHDKWTKDLNDMNGMRRNH